MLKVRKLTLKDHYKVFDLFSSSINSQFPEYSLKVREAIIKNRKFWSNASYKKRLQNKDRLLLGAFINNRLVGLIDTEMPFAGVSFASWLIVHSNHQKQNIGSSLVKAWEKKMLQLGAHLLYLLSAQRNVQFYLKLGFQDVGIFRKAWFGLDDHIFTKLIAEPKEANFLK